GRSARTSRFGYRKTRATCRSNSPRIFRSVASTCCCEKPSNDGPKKPPVERPTLARFDQRHGKPVRRIDPLLDLSEPRPLQYPHHLVGPVLVGTLGPDRLARFERHLERRT